MILVTREIPFRDLGSDRTVRFGKVLCLFSPIFQRSVCPQLDGNSFMAPEWSNEEETIAIFFWSRCVHPMTVRCLLLRRGFNFSVVFHRKRLVFVAQRHHPGLV